MYLYVYLTTYAIIYVYTVIYVIKDFQLKFVYNYICNHTKQEMIVNHV